MLVEASRALAASTRANRPDAIVEHAALVSPDLSGQCLGDPGGEPTGSVGMGSVQGASGVQGAPCLHVQGVTLSELVRLNSWLQHLSGPDTHTMTHADLMSYIHCLRRIHTQLDKHGITHVDLLSLDVEGLELEALRGLDLTRHRPTWILVEVSHIHHRIPASSVSSLNKPKVVYLPVSI